MNSHLLCFTTPALAWVLFSIILASASAETHTVTFRRMNGTVLSKVEVVHGGSVDAPEGPVEADHVFKGWDHGDWLGCVTNDIQVWALYEGTKTWARGTNYGSQSIVFRDEPYSLDEYFRMYDNLAWADEFSRDGTNNVNSTYWNYDTENRHELNYETSGDNQKEYGGNLAINVRREKRTRNEYVPGSGFQTVEYDFTGGGIKSNGKVAFKYGRCEIRAKLTRQKGCWPAFWMMGNTGQWPACGELDILEQPSGGDWTAGTLHINPPSGSGSIGSGSVVTPQDGVHFGDGYHRFGTIMNEREVIWYVDDHIFKRMDVRDSRYHMCHDRPWFIIFGMGIQSNVWVQVPDAPATKYDVPELDERGVDFLVDYCRIFTNTNEGNTVTYDAPEASAKLSAPVNATVWRGWDMNYGRTGASAYQNNINTGYAEVDYIKAALTEYLVGRKMDVLTFLTEPNISTSQNRGEYDIPGYTMMSISFNGNQWNSWDNTGNGNMGRTQLFGNALFNRDRFSASESGVDFVTLSSDTTFTNCYALCADLKEKATGARVKVVSVNVTTTNGIEDVSGTVAQGFDTLFSKLNDMKNDNVIVFFQGMSQALYNYIKGRADSELQSPYTFAGKYTSTYANQCAYVTENISASAAHPANIPVPKKSPTVSYQHNPQALQATVTFDELPEVDDGYADTFDAADYAKELNVTFSGYSGTALANFPVLVKLSTAIAGFDYADFAWENGGDLRFTDAAGNLLPHEIDTWDENGVSTVWVKVPTLTADATITARYGCATPVRPSAAKVWDDNYVGVWHLGESGLPLRESSGASTDFSLSTGQTIGYAAAGAVGGSVDFANGPSNSVVAIDHVALDGFSRFTIEAWTKQSTHKTNAGILSKRESSSKNISYYLLDNSSSTVLYIGTNTTSSSRQASSSVKPVAGSWAHQVYSVDMTTTSSNVRGYLNGVAASPGSVDFGVSAVPNGIGNLCLGNLTPNGRDNSFNGSIDEVRISKCVRSEAWIKATHDTVMQADFAAYAMVVPEPDPAVVTDAEGYDWTNRVVTVTGAAADETLTLTLSSPDGTPIGTVTATTDSEGVATFDVATAPGSNYVYAVSQDGTTIASGAFHTGGWNADGAWFLALPDGQGGSTEENGAWTTPPTGTNATSYTVSESAAFSLSENALSEGREKLVRVETGIVYGSLFEENSNPQADFLATSIAAIIPVTNSVAGGAAKWAAYVGGAWTTIAGDIAPDIDTPYIVRFESDFTLAAPRVRFSVSADGGATFATLSDVATGAEWLVPTDSGKTELSEVVVDGSGVIAGISGELANADVATADGTAYASLEEALANGGQVMLLTNTTWPTNAPVGTVAVDRGGYSILLPPDGVTVDGNTVVVSAGFSSIAGEGPLYVTFDDLANLGIATAGRSPAQIAADLRENGANGIPKWQSYVLGLDVTDATALPLANIALGTEDDTVSLSLEGVEVNPSARASVTYQVFEAKDLSDPSQDVAIGDPAPGVPISVEMDGTGSQLFRLKVIIDLD